MTAHRSALAERAPTEADAPSEAITLLNDLAAAGAEREETNSASAHAPRCRHSAARNATACLTSTSNNAFTGFRRTMDQLDVSQLRPVVQNRRRGAPQGSMHACSCLSFRPLVRKRPNPGKVPATGIEG